MTAISDAVVIGVVLGLVFAAVSYYLYSRQTQLERKIGLMENILLELKITTEQTLLSSTEDHLHNQSQMQSHTEDVYDQVQEENKNVQDTSSGSVETREAIREVFIEQVPRTQDEKPSSASSSTSVSLNYESLTYKELLHIARQRGITGLRTMSKAQVIDALKNNDNPLSVSDTIPLSSWKSTPIEELTSAQDGTNSILATLDFESEPDQVAKAPEGSLVGSE